jgi:hypothetical protein
MSEFSLLYFTMEFLITMCIIDCLMDFSYHVDERTKEVLVNKNKVTCVEG